jgi:hypothetical protein
MRGRSAVTGERATDLRPGEAGLTLKPDPYYGVVDTGPASKAPGGPGVGGPPGLPPGLITDDLTEWLDDVQSALDAGWRALGREDQNRVEVLTGRRLQQMRPPPRRDEPQPQ